MSVDFDAADLNASDSAMMIARFCTFQGAEYLGWERLAA